MVDLCTLGGPLSRLSTSVAGSRAHGARSLRGALVVNTPLLLAQSVGPRGFKLPLEAFLLSRVCVDAAGASGAKGWDRTDGAPGGPGLVSALLCSDRGVVHLRK